MKEYRSAAYTFTGRRTRNQDNFLLNGQIPEAKHGNETAAASGEVSGPLLFAVVDGAGTKTTGETASHLVCKQLWAERDKFEEVHEIVQITSIINEALEKVNKEIESIMVDEPTSKMGATAAVLLIYNGKALFGNVGDSAVYLRRDGKMQKLTRDHTEGEELLARGALTEDMLKIHSSKSHVTRKIGYMTFNQTDIMQFYDVIDIQNDDVFVLASPGVVQYLSPDDISTGLQSCIDLTKSVERVVKSAMDHDSKDNTTAMVVKVNDKIDSIGNTKVKAKPIRSRSVHVHTSIEIDPNMLKKLAYVLATVAILAFSVIYVITQYPEDTKLVRIEYQDDINDSADDDDNSLHEETVVSGDTQNSENTDVPAETAEPTETSDDTALSSEASDSSGDISKD